MVWQLVVIALISYLLGSINFSIIISRLMGKGDIREQGSGNAGTTNTLRVLGKLPALGVLVGDVLKGVISVLIAKWIITLGNSADTPEAIAMLGKYRDYAMIIASVMAILGHNFPIYFRFKGGKGVATSLGVLLAIEWRLAVVCIIFGIVMILITRMVSVGSILGAILYPILAWIMGTEFSNNWTYLIFALVLAASILVRHIPNIKRIINGTENKLWKTKAEKLNDAIDKQENNEQ